MKLIDLIAYTFMFLAAVAWGGILYGGFGLPRLISIIMSIFLGPISVILVSFFVTRFFDDR